MWKCADELRSRNQQTILELGFWSGALLLVSFLHMHESMGWREKGDEVTVSSSGSIVPYCFQLSGSIAGTDAMLRFELKE